MVEWRKQAKRQENIAKVFKDMMETKIGEEIQSDCVVMQWLVRWVAMLYSRFKIGADGKTSYERQKGRKCKQEVVTSLGSFSRQLQVTSECGQFN